jgi:hypothetical protein
MTGITRRSLLTGIALSPVAKALNAAPVAQKFGAESMVLNDWLDLDECIIATWSNDACVWQFSRPSVPE